MTSTNAVAMIATVMERMRISFLASRVLSSTSLILFSTCSRMRSAANLVLPDFFLPPSSPPLPPYFFLPLFSPPLLPLHEVGAVAADAGEPLEGVDGFAADRVVGLA